ncbi:MAG: hypothetical protein GF353_10185 [Candidatus Lokiarchaeota archaeon]|nr:hypothetical protein [Candidatus Lokiarchaeota archaeon]
MMETEEIAKYIKGIVICKESGEYLLDLILDSELNPVLLSSFVGALSLFGKGNLGKIEEINIQGLDVNMVIVYKYNLILIAILSKEFMTDDIRSEAEKALDMFYSSYVNEVNDFKEVVNISIFKEFKKLLYMQIHDLSEILNDKEKEAEVKDFGFFTDAIKKWKNHKEAS